MSGHTPTPWEASYYKSPFTDDNKPPRLERVVGPSGEGICVKGFTLSTGDEEAIANAEFIVLAVNSYDELVAEVALWKDRYEAADQALNATIRDWNNSLNEGSP